MTATETRLKTLEFVLPRELSEYVDGMIATKQFSSADSLIVAALYAFRDVAELNRLKHERLKSEIHHAVEQADRGELFDGEEVFAELERDLQEAKDHAA